MTRESVFETKEDKEKQELLALKRASIDCTIEFTKPRYNFPYACFPNDTYEIVSVEHISILSEPYTSIGMLICSIKKFRSSPGVFYKDAVVIPIPLKFVRTKTINIHNLKTYLQKLQNIGIIPKLFCCTKTDDFIFSISLVEKSIDIPFYSQKLLFNSRYDYDSISLKNYLELLRPIISKQQMLQEIEQQVAYRPGLAKYFLTQQHFNQQREKLQ